METKLESILNYAKESVQGGLLYMSMPLLAPTAMRINREYEEINPIFDSEQDLSDHKGSIALGSLGLTAEFGSLLMAASSPETAKYVLASALITIGTNIASGTYEMMRTHKLEKTGNLPKRLKGIRL